MKLTFATKYNGIYYKAGQEIPVADNKVVKNEIEEEKAIETPVEKADEEVVEKPKKVVKKTK